MRGGGGACAALVPSSPPTTPAHNLGGGGACAALVPSSTNPLLVGSACATLNNPGTHSWRNR